MSNQLKKKNRKKKKKNDEDEIVPQYHEKVGNVNVYSEQVSKLIIEKIISLVLSDSLKKRVEQDHGDICFQEAKKLLDNIIELTHINHDTDDFDIDKIEINNYVKYYNTDTNMKRDFIKRHNAALAIRNKKIIENLEEEEDEEENKLKKLEDNLNKSTLVENNKYFSKGKIYQYDIDIIKNNFWGNIPCPKVNNIDRTVSNYNIFIPRKVEYKNDININESKKKSKGLNKKKMFMKKNTFGYQDFVSRLSKNISLIKDKKENNLLEILNKKKEPLK